MNMNMFLTILKHCLENEFIYASQFLPAGFKAHIIVLSPVIMFIHNVCYKGSYPYFKELAIKRIFNQRALGTATPLKPIKYVYNTYRHKTYVHNQPHASIDYINEINI